MTDNCSHDWHPKAVVVLGVLTPAVVCTKCRQEFFGADVTHRMIWNSALSSEILDSVDRRRVRQVVMNETLKKYDPHRCGCKDCITSKRALSFAVDLAIARYKEALADKRRS